LVTRRLRAIRALTLCVAVTHVAGEAAGRSDAQQQTWTGAISDSMCKRHHESGAEGQETTDPDCTRDCVKGGSKYVVIVGDRVYAIANQDHNQLAEHAGMRVILSGTLHGEAIEVATVEKAR
jgi:hypothetical protein